MGAWTTRVERRGSADEQSGVRRARAHEPEERVGPYRVLAVLGKGGMGVVYLARSHDERGMVALKCLSVWCGSEELVRRFESEAYVHGALRHPNIVRLLDRGSDPERYIAMEHVDGASLHGLRSTLRDALPITAALHVAERAAAALAHAHAKRDAEGRSLGIVHRDVSPSNILLSLRGGVKLTDFGLARHENRDWETATGMTLGKIGYMAPEVLLEAPVGPSADVYSLGVVLWECLTGRLLVARGSVLRAAEQIVEGDHPPPSVARSSIAPDLDALVLRMLSREPARRPSAREAARSLRSLGDPRRGRRELARMVRTARTNEVAP